MAGEPAPEALAKHLEGKPAVRQWLVQCLGVKALQTDAPVIQHEDPDLVPAIARQFTALFHNQDCRPDASVMAAGHQIWVHIPIIAKCVHSSPDAGIHITTAWVQMAGSSPSKCMLAASSKIVQTYHTTLDTWP